MLLLTDKNTDIGQNRDNVPPLSQFCPPEIRDKSTENRDKNLDKRECVKEKITPPRSYGKYENVFLTEKEYHALISDYPDEYMEMIEHLSAYMVYSGRTYENHLATMEYWKAEDRKREKQEKAGKQGYVYNGRFKEGESL